MYVTFVPFGARGDGNGWVNQYLIISEEGFEVKLRGK